MTDIIEQLTSARTRMSEAVVQMDTLIEKVSQDDLDLGTIQLNVHDLQLQVSATVGTLDYIHKVMEEELNG